MTLQRGKGFAKTVRVPSYEGKGDWPNRHITFIVAKKLNLQFYFALFSLYVEEGAD